MSFFESFRQPPHIHLGWVVAHCALWTLLGLVGHDPWKPDEASGFGLVYSILQGGDWVIPMLAGEPFMERPPLYYLTAAALAKIFSGWLPLHDGARLASGFYMGLALLFTGLTGRELWGKGYGRITALIMIACLGLVVRTHQIITDTALLAGVAIALYGLALAPRRPVIAGIIIGSGIGVGFMSKGLFEPGIIAITALLLPFLSSAWRSRRYAICLAIAFVAALPWLAIWPFLLYQRAPELFMEWLWVNNLGHLTGSTPLLASHEPGYYFTILPWFAWPALPLALWTLWRHNWKDGFIPAIALPLTAFLVILLVLSTAVIARDVYALPLLPPLAVLATAAVNSLRRGAANSLDWFSVMTFSLFAGVLWLAWYASLTGHPTEVAHWVEKRQPGYIVHINGLALFLAASLSTAWLVVVARMKRSALRGIVNSALGITLAWGLLATIWLPWLDSDKSYRAMIVSLQGSLPSNYNCIGSKQLGEPQRALLHYFAGIITLRDEVDDSHCELKLIQNGAHLPEQTELGWKPIWQGRRQGDKTELYTLLKKL
jgi:4-amino-4-deoxy-L-arabinose transferase-like glycosyltransferase